jgi:hypothetical protein
MRYAIARGDENGLPQRLHHGRARAQQQPGGGHEAANRVGELRRQRRRAWKTIRTTNVNVLRRYARLEVPEGFNARQVTPSTLLHKT